MPTAATQQAYELGVDHAKADASWILDGNTDRENYVRLLQMLDDGDPAAYDYLPAMPNLSGEWADDLTPQRLAIEILGDDTVPDPIIDDLCEAYEEGVEDTFAAECERLLRSVVER